MSEPLKSVKYRTTGDELIHEIRENFRKFEQSKARAAFRRRIVNLIVLAVLTGIIYALSPLP